jgi:hypothetical protein
MREDTIEDANAAAIQAEQASPKIERTVAFFADPRAATLLLTETISQMIAALSIERGLVDLSSIPGLSIAAAFELAGVPYEAMVFGQEDQYDTALGDREPVQNPYIAADAARFRLLADGVREISSSEFASIDANVALIPAMAGPDEKLIDFSPLTVTGAVLTQLENVQRSLVIVDTPERGLRSMPDGSYQRAVIHVAGA